MSPENSGLQLGIPTRLAGVREAAVKTLGRLPWRKRAPSEAEQTAGAILANIQSAYRQRVYGNDEEAERKALHPLWLNFDRYLHNPQEKSLQRVDFYRDGSSSLKAELSDQQIGTAVLREMIRSHQVQPLQDLIGRLNQPRLDRALVGVVEAVRDVRKQQQLERALDVFYDAIDELAGIRGKDWSGLERAIGVFNDQAKRFNQLKEDLRRGRRKSLKKVAKRFRAVNQAEINFYGPANYIDWRRLLFWQDLVRETDWEIRDGHLTGRTAEAPQAAPAAPAATAATVGQHAPLSQNFLEELQAAIAARPAAEDMPWIRSGFGVDLYSIADRLGSGDSLEEILPGTSLSQQQLRDFQVALEANNPQVPVDLRWVYLYGKLSDEGRSRLEDYLNSLDKVVSQLTDEEKEQIVNTVLPHLVAQSAPAPTPPHTPTGPAAGGGAETAEGEVSPWNTGENFQEWNSVASLLGIRCTLGGTLATTTLPKDQVLRYAAALFSGDPSVSPDRRWLYLENLLTDEGAVEFYEYLIKHYQKRAFDLTDEEKREVVETLLPDLVRRLGRPAIPADPSFQAIYENMTAAGLAPDDAAKSIRAAEIFAFENGISIEEALNRQDEW